MPTTVGGLPFGTAATVSGADITVSMLINSPRIIERRIGEAVNYRYFADLILPNVGAPGGGVLIYQEWDPRYSVMSRKPEELAADAEVPLAATVEGDWKVARAVWDGLGYVVTDPERKRNMKFAIDRKERALANSMADHFNLKAVTAIKAAITAGSRTFEATDWSALITNGADPDPDASWPHSTLGLVLSEQITARVPWAYDSMIAHTKDVWRLKTIYLGTTANGQAATFSAANANALVAAKLGLKTIIEDNTGGIERGKPILYSSGNVGGTAWEEPITVEVVAERRRRRDVVQCVGSAAYFVDNPYGLLQLEGVADADIAAEA